MTYKEGWDQMKGILASVLKTGFEMKQDGKVNQIQHAIFETCATIYSEMYDMESEISPESSFKCSFDNGITIKPDGINELDPCIYEHIERHEDVTVDVFRCKNCGHIDVRWQKK